MEELEANKDSTPQVPPKNRGDLPNPNRFSKKTRSKRYYKKKTIYKTFSFVEKAKYFSLMEHNGANNYYYSVPYETHLTMVTDYAYKYLYLLDSRHHDNVLAACWCHDLLGSTRVKYSDIERLLNFETAEIVRCVTSDPRGRTRKERLNNGILKEIQSSKEATFVKVCERIANTVYTRVKKKEVYDVFRNEYFDFAEALFRHDLSSLFKELEKITFSPI
jgi:(p)ppGpp synthase/HD superfamily hydrolase